MEGWLRRSCWHCLHKSPKGRHAVGGCPAVNLSVGKGRVSESCKQLLRCVRQGTRSEAGNGLGGREWTPRQGPAHENFVCQAKEFGFYLPGHR